MTSAIRFLVSGRVQGVGFRYAAQDKAQVLGLSGWVRNRRDGDVEGVAQGPQESLESFENWLWQGPRHAGVSRVTTDTVPITVLQGFNITR
jgi:acylphosphatase